LEQLRQSRLRIGVSKIDAAVALLTQHGWDAHGDNGFVVSTNIQEAAAMNRALVDAGFAVHHLVVESASLEEVFLGMTHAEVA